MISFVFFFAYDLKVSIEVKPSSNKGSGSGGPGGGGLQGGIITVDSPASLNEMFGKFQELVKVCPCAWPCMCARAFVCVCSDCVLEYFLEIIVCLV